MQPHSPTATISRYINTHPLAVISTADSEGRPSGATIYAGSDDELNVYFMTKSETTKNKNISAQPIVALTFSGEDHQTTLQLSGVAHEISEQADGAPAFQILGSIKHASEDFRLPITKISAGNYIIYKIITERATLTEYERSSRMNGVAKVEYRR